jgi:alcohol dehydrogenase
MLAVQALKLISQSIQAAVHQGQDLQARSNMMLGATLAGQAFANAPVAGVHALAYPLGGQFHIPHGLSNSLVLPHVLRFNKPAAAHLYAELADIMLPEISLKLVSDNDKTDAFIEFLENLIIDLGLPNTLASVGINRDSLDALTKDALKQERLLVNNPRAMNEMDILAIYQAAY